MEIVAEIERAEGVKDTLRAALFKVNKVFGPVATPPTASATATGGESSTSTVKLPKLKLAQFDGEYTKWKTFWDSFEHNRRDKFTYLIPLLVRSAKEALAGLSLTSANYHEAIDIPKKRFGDESQIITKHMEAFTGLEPVTDNRNLPALRRLYDKVETHVRGLRSLGVPHSACGALLTPLLIKKLPQELRVLINRKMTGKEWEFNSIIEALLEEIEARERAGVTSRGLNPPIKNKRVPVCYHLDH